jgi:hypothetical protein
MLIYKKKNLAQKIKEGFENEDNRPKKKLDLCTQFRGFGKFLLDFHIVPKPIKGGAQSGPTNQYPDGE